jgi:hypothetical protein
MTGLWTNGLEAIRRCNQRYLKLMQDERTTEFLNSEYKKDHEVVRNRGFLNSTSLNLSFQALLVR